MARKPVKRLPIAIRFLAKKTLNYVIQGHSTAIFPLMGTTLSATHQHFSTITYLGVQEFRPAAIGFKLVFRRAPSRFRTRHLDHGSIEHLPQGFEARDIDVSLGIL
jgi:hypothetical protein